jgi:hypothetical protein
LEKKDYEQVEVNGERTGMRDAWLHQFISKVHRTWGPSTQMVDADWVIAEHSNGMPVAVIEFKSKFGQRVLFPEDDINLKCLKALADNSKIPFIVVWYWRPEAAFKISVENDYAGDYFTDQEMLTERDFVERVYLLRGMSLPIGIADRLKTEIPKEYQGYYKRQQERKAGRNA